MQDDTQDKSLRCPKCGSTDVRRSMHQGFLDQLFRLLGYAVQENLLAL
jgi:hypothetical protein